MSGLCSQGAVQISLAGPVLGAVICGTQKWLLCVAVPANQLSVGDVRSLCHSVTFQQCHTSPRRVSDRKKNVISTCLASEFGKQLALCYQCSKQSKVSCFGALNLHNLR